MLPLSLDQYYDCFWADEAPYLVIGVVKDYEDQVLNVTDWTPPSEGNEVKLNRTVI